MPTPPEVPAEPANPTTPETAGASTSPAEPGRGPDTAPRRRRRRVLTIVSLSVLALLVIAVSAFVYWANDTYAAEPAGLAAVRDDPRVELDDRGDVVILTPTGESDGRGLVFLSGAKVDPQAYAATFQEVAAEGTTVVIVKPFLNLAILERRPLDAFTDLVPEIDSWAVGGHSMGGVKACSYAETGEVDALVLLASYCSGDALADSTDLDVLSVSGTQDGLATPEKIDDSLGDLPASTTVVRIDGASHAQFGDYGDQPGDGTPTISDDEARERITEALVPFLAPR